MALNGASNGEVKQKYGQFFSGSHKLLLGCFPCLPLPIFSVSADACLSHDVFFQNPEKER